MIERFRLIRNIGNFDSISPNPHDTSFNRLVLIYAENGRGKTTIGSILRSLATGEARFIEERKRIGSQHPPNIIIEVDGRTIIYNNRVWADRYTHLFIFDDLFVHENVYSGLHVDSVHRQNLHELIVGRHGVTLARRVQELTQQIADAQAIVRQKETEISADIRGDLTVEDFCAIAPVDNIEQKINESERSIAALNDAGIIQVEQEFEPITIPNIEFSDIRSVATYGLPELDSKSLAMVQARFEALGPNGEEWIEIGTNYLSQMENGEGTVCPFCSQEIAGNMLIVHYRTYFGEAYKSLKSQIKVLIEKIENLLSGDALAQLQRQLEDIRRRHQFWSKYVELPPLELDLEEMARTWTEARKSLLAILNNKVAEPLEQISISAEDSEVIAKYAEVIGEIEEKILQLNAVNDRIKKVKLDVAEGDLVNARSELVKLRTIQMRFNPEIEQKCRDYLEAKAQKDALVVEKETARIELDHHRNTIFPRYQGSINECLRKFNANFRIREVQAINPGGRPSSTYNIEINQVLININNGRQRNDTPSFKNTLSAGDRNTLALAFFFAALDQETNLTDCTVILDDPVSSLDEARSIVTAQEIRRLIGRACQVIVLSHSKKLLCSIWHHMNQAHCVALEIARCPTGSTIRPWNIHDAAITEYDRRHRVLCSYVNGEMHYPREIAQSLRPTIEGYLRVVCTEHFPPGSLLGPFLEQARRSLAGTTPILSAADVQELNDMKEYANRFHHDTNPAWDEEVANINEAQLVGFVQRVLAFTRRPL